MERGERKKKIEDKDEKKCCYWTNSGNYSNQSVILSCCLTVRFKHIWNTYYQTLSWNIISSLSVSTKQRCILFRMYVQIVD